MSIKFLGASPGDHRGMQRLPASGVRRFMMWFFDRPSNDPYVSLTFDVAVEPALRFLDAFAREHGERPGLQHVFTSALARCLRELPALNVKILGRTLYQLERVDIAVPVHLGADGKQSGRDETGMIIVRHADRKSLLEVARETRQSARAERAGEITSEGTALLRRLLARAPDGLLYAGLDLSRRVLEQPLAYRLLEDRFGVSSAVTNVGAVFALPKGGRFRAGAVTVPAKAGHVASVFGLGPVEEAAVVEGGAVSARKVLPVMMVVDHRAVDGFLMAKAAAQLCSLLQDPARLA